MSDTETSDDLADAVADGAAFHHAGLSRGHRELVEDAFRDRLVKVVCATPTLAAGVNTPSRRVVVRDWRRYDGSAGGMAPLSVLEVHQMMGRAGRPGLDPYGEAVLFAPGRRRGRTVRALRLGRPGAGPVETRGRTGTADSHPRDGRLWLRTLPQGTARVPRTDAVRQPDRRQRPARTRRRRRAHDLQRNDFLEIEAGELDATSLGHTVSRLYLDPMSAAEIVDGLRDWERGASDSTSASGSPADAQAEPPANSGFTTASELAEDADESDADRDPDDISALGLYHLVSRTPDMYQLYLRSGDREEYEMELFEREEELLGPTPSEFEEGRFEDWLSALKTARLLEDWATEVDEATITDRYGVGPGDIRGKVETAQWLLGAAESLASEVDLDAARAISEARIRVEHGVREELVDLAGVRGVGRKRARRLFRPVSPTAHSSGTRTKPRAGGASRPPEDGRERPRSRRRPDPSMEGVEPAPDAPSTSTMVQTGTSANDARPAGQSG